MKDEPRTETRAERQRRQALARWENEGGADPCGPQVPGVGKDCESQEAAEDEGAD